jgi:signal transduction histidine kinase
VVRTAVGEIRVTAEEQGLELELSCPERGLMVNGDPEQLDRALTNLLSKATTSSSARWGSGWRSAGIPDMTSS